MTRQLQRVLFLFLLTASTLAQGGEAARIIRDTQLKAEPFSDAATLQELKGNTQVTKESRKGGWYQIKVGDKAGWVRMSVLRLGTEQAQGSSGLGSTLQFLQTGRSGASDVTVATGLRGLDAADLTNATPDHKALEQFKQHKISPKAAKKFASTAKLKAHKMAYVKIEQHQPESSQESDGGGVEEFFGE